MYHYIIYIPSLQFMIQHLIYLNCRISVERGWPGAERVSMLSLTALGKRGRTGIWQLLNHLILSWKCDKIPCTPLSPNLTSIIKISPTFILPHTTHITNCENKHPKSTSRQSTNQITRGLLLIFLTLPGCDEVVTELRVLSRLDILCLSRRVSWS